MRVAVISDIHGNDLAFQAIEAVIQQQAVDQIVCVGDAVQGGPQPAEVVQRLLRWNCPVVMGNADAWLITGKETDDEGIPRERLKKMEAVRNWSLSQLTQEDIDFVSSFGPTVNIHLDDGLELL